MYPILPTTGANCARPGLVDHEIGLLYFLNVTYPTLDTESPYGNIGSMKTTIDIPEKVLKEAMELTGAKTKREAIVTAVRDYNDRRKMARLARHLGSCEELMTPAELEQLRSAD